MINKAKLPWQGPDGTPAKPTETLDLEWAQHQTVSSLMEFLDRWSTKVNSWSVKAEEKLTLGRDPDLECLLNNKEFQEAMTQSVERLSVYISSMRTELFNLLCKYQKEVMELAYAKMEQNPEAFLAYQQSRMQYEHSTAKMQETNRRLNRRCQELEAEIARRDRADKAVMTQLNAHSHRVHSYANQLRDELHENHRSLHAGYKKQWQRLPKPDGPIDGIEPRINHTLNLLRELER